ncbi:Gfo/Idh/MocA family oxidoreductase, partial [Mesorhizobium sp.]
AAASRHGKVEDIPNFPTIEAMLDAVPELDAVSLCMPPQFRYDAARTALAAKKHVFLEKPPGATVSEVEDLKALAVANGVSLFASWHSRYAPAVEAARDFLGSTTIRSAAINWKEDVRRWHPNQDWIWAPGGFGVFDPGINALSIATHILPAMFITSAILDFPENRAAPIAAHIAFRTSNGLPVTMELDWRQTGPQSWDILAETDKGAMVLSGGGSKLAVDGGVVHDEPEAEYPMLYKRFAEIVRAGVSDVDLAPLQHVADAFMLGKRNVVEAFFD